MKVYIAADSNRCDLKWLALPSRLEEKLLITRACKGEWDYKRSEPLNRWLENRPWSQFGNHKLFHWQRRKKSTAAEAGAASPPPALPPKENLFEELKVKSGILNLFLCILTFFPKKYRGNEESKAQMRRKGFRLPDLALFASLLTRTCQANGRCKMPISHKRPYHRILCSESVLLISFCKEKFLNGSEEQDALASFAYLLGVPKPGCYKPGCLQFLCGSALLHSFAPFCALLRSSVDLRLRSFAHIFVYFCAHLRVSANDCVLNDRVWELQDLWVRQRDGEVVIRRSGRENIWQWTAPNLDWAFHESEL